MSTLNTSFEQNETSPKQNSTSNIRSLVAAISLAASTLLSSCQEKFDTVLPRNNNTIATQSVTDTRAGKMDFVETENSLQTIKSESAYKMYQEGRLKEFGTNYSDYRNKTYTDFDQIANNSTDEYNVAFSFKKLYELYAVASQKSVSEVANLSLTQLLEKISVPGFASVKNPTFIINGREDSVSPRTITLGDLITFKENPESFIARYSDVLDSESLNALKKGDFSLSIGGDAYFAGYPSVNKSSSSRVARVELVFPQGEQKPYVKFLTLSE